MSDKRRPRGERIDSVDRDSIELMLSSRAWQLYSRRLTRELERRTEDLIREHPETETAKIRGQIESLRLALQLPQILMKEGRPDGDETPRI